MIIQSDFEHVPVHSVDFRQVKSRHYYWVVYLLNENKLVAYRRGCCPFSKYQRGKRCQKSSPSPFFVLFSVTFYVIPKKNYNGK